MEGESGDDVIEGDVDDRFVAWEHVYDVLTEGQGVASDTRGYGDEGQTNEDGDDYSVEKGEVVDVHNADAVEDDADGIYSENGYVHCIVRTTEIQVAVMLIVWVVEKVLCTQHTLRILS